MLGVRVSDMLASSLPTAHYYSPLALFTPPFTSRSHQTMSASIPFFKHLLRPALVTVTPPSLVLLRLASDPPPDIAARTGAELCEIIVLAIENGHRQQQMALVRDAYKYLVALHHLPAGTTVDLWWNRLCAVHDSTEFKKAVFIVAALLREDDTLLLQYIRDQFFPVSYLRYCLLDFVQRQGDQVLHLFRQAKCRWEALGRPLTSDEFGKLYDDFDTSPKNRARSAERGQRPKKEAVTVDPYKLLQLPRSATVTDIQNAVSRHLKALSRDLKIYRGQNFARRDLFRLVAAKAINQEKQTRPPCTASRQQESMELSTDQTQLAKKRKVRAVTDVRPVTCDVCKQDCVSSGKITRMCLDERCVRECHVQCLSSPAMLLYWRCSQCLNNTMADSSAVSTIGLVDKSANAQHNQAPTPTANNTAHGPQTVLDGRRETSAERKRRFRPRSVHIEAGLPIVVHTTGPPRDVSASEIGDGRRERIGALANKSDGVAGVGKARGG